MVIPPACTKYPAAPLPDLDEHKVFVLGEHEEELLGDGDGPAQNVYEECTALERPVWQESKSAST